MTRSSRLLTIVLVIAALAVGATISKLMPRAEAILNMPFVRQSDVGKPAETRIGTFTVLSAKVATTGVGRGYQDTWVAQNDGVIVLVTVRFEPKGETVSLLEPRLIDEQGRTYSGPGGLTNSIGLTHPGMYTVTDLMFEVPKGAVPTLALWIPAVDYLDGGGDDVAKLPLGLAPVSTNPTATVTAMPTKSAGVVKR